MRCGWCIQRPYHSRRTRFGTVVFDGMAQFAPDLILLGAIPVIVLSLAVERGLSLIEDRAAQAVHG